MASSLVRVEMRGLVWSLAIFLMERKNVEMVIFVLFFATLFSLDLSRSKSEALPRGERIGTTGMQRKEQNKTMFSFLTFKIAS